MLAPAPFSRSSLPRVAVRDHPGTLTAFLLTSAGGHRESRRCPRRRVEADHQEVCLFSPSRHPTFRFSSSRPARPHPSLRPECARAITNPEIDAGSSSASSSSRTTRLPTDASRPPSAAATSLASLRSRRALAARSGSPKTCVLLVLLSGRARRISNELKLTIAHSAG